jgi:hypothetical protein
MFAIETFEVMRPRDFAGPVGRDENASDGLQRGRGRASAIAGQAVMGRQRESRHNGCGQRQASLAEALRMMSANSIFGCVTFVAC